jgi:hypothetical protein
VFGVAETERFAKILYGFRSEYINYISVVNELIGTQFLGGVNEGKRSLRILDVDVQAMTSVKISIM